MQENLILAYYAQIWKFGTRPPENEFFWKLLIFMERSLNFASNEPSTAPRHKVLIKLCKKLDFESRTQPRVEELPVLYLRDL